MGEGETLGEIVVNGAQCACSFGSAPSALVVKPNIVTIGGQPAATINDHAPIVNVQPFTMCSSPSNPAVAAASMAPQPCVPVTTSPWTPGAGHSTINETPVLTLPCQLMCNWGGVITVTTPPQTIASSS